MIKNEDFNVMVNELLHQKPVSFDMLCSIAEKMLRSSVKRWCAMDDALSGKGFEGDIMNDIHVRLIKTAVSHFLLKDGADGKVNYNPDGFEDWIFKVAKNITRDYASRERKIRLNTAELDEDAECLPDTEQYDTLSQDERDKRLIKAFSIVLNSDAHVYKVLTWVAQSLFIIKLDISKIKSTERIIQTFEQKTLYEMRDYLVQSSNDVRWLKLSDEQMKKVDGSLDIMFDGSRKYGEVVYREFFMKKGGKATISDWVNRMNGLVKRVMTNEALNG